MSAGEHQLPVNRLMQQPQVTSADLILISQGTTSPSPGSIGATHQLGSLTTDAGGTTQYQWRMARLTQSDDHNPSVTLLFSDADATLTSTEQRSIVI